MKTKSMIITVIVTSLLFSCSMNSNDNSLPAPEKASETSKPEPVAPAAPAADPVNAAKPAVSANRMLISPDGSAVTFTCKAESTDGTLSYQWYSSPDGSEENKSAIDKATSATYTTEAFTQKEIRYYFCTVTNTISDNGDKGNKTASQTTAFYAAYTGLPVLYLDTEVETNQITRDNYVKGSLKIISEEYGNFSYEFKKEKEGIKGRGNSSWGMPKKGYNIKFDKKQVLFNLPESKKWCIVANYSDKSLLRNKFSSVIGTKIFNSEWNPTFINVDVVMNGEYQGNYTFCEKNTIGSGRIDIQDISDLGKSKFSDINGDGQKDLNDGGFVLEIDARHDADFWFDTTKGVPFTLKDPDEVSLEIQEHIKGIVQSAEDVLYSNIFSDSENGWRKYIDETSVIDWYLANEFAKNVDAPFYLSLYMTYSPSDTKLHLGPNWDFDIGFGNADYTNDGNTTSCEIPDGWYIKIARIGTYENWIIRMFQDSTFVEKVKERWNNKKLELFYHLYTDINNLSENMKISAEYNFIKWQILGSYVWPNAAGYENRTNYKSEVDYLLDWCNKRFQWLDTAINNL